MDDGRRILGALCLQLEKPLKSVQFIDDGWCKLGACCLHYVVVRVPRPDFGPYPALRVKVFFFADSGSLDGMLQFPGGW